MRYLFFVVLLFAGRCVYSQENLRFRASVDGAIGLGQDISNDVQTVGNGIATVTLGLTKHGFMIGGGTGIFKMKGTKTHDYYIPVYGELSYLAQRDKVAPFFSVKVGKLLPQKDADNPNRILNKATMMYNPIIGLSIDVKALYIVPFFEYFVPADFNSHYDTFGMGLRIMTH